MTNFLKELSKNKENYFCMAVIILLLVYLFCNTCNKENLVMTGSSGNNMSQVLGLNSNGEIVLSEQLSNVGAAVPIGTILMWSPGSVNKKPANIPSGWYKCDGNQIKLPNGTAGPRTPDLSGRFIKGMGGKDLQGNPDILGASVNKAAYKLQLTDLPPHDHIGLPGTKCTSKCPLNTVPPGNGYSYRDGVTLGIDGWPKISGTNNPQPQTSFKVSDPDYYVVIYIIKMH